MGKRKYKNYNNFLRAFRIWDIYILLYKKLPKYYHYMIKKRYKNLDRFKVNIFDVSFYISIDDFYSKTWVFIRCDQDIIHEEKATKLMGEKLKNSKCFVDVGAHLGYFTLFASKIISKGKIFSFELDKINYNLLKKNIQLNNCKNVEIFNYAISDKPGEIKYFRSSDQPMPNLDILGIPADDSESKIISVNSITLDDFFKYQVEKPDIVKIDVEGAEMIVLKGMKKIIKDYKPMLFIEIHPNVLPKFESSVKDVFTFLKKNEYKIYEFTDMRNIWKDRFLKELDNYTKINKNTMFFAC